MRKALTQWCVFVFVCFIVVAVMGPVVYAADPNGAFLQYQEPKTTASSTLSNIAYVFSLLFTFAVIIGLAYFTSRFLGERVGKLQKTGNQKILATIPLGTNRAVTVVEIAGKVLVLGISDHNINLLQEITSPEEIDRLRTQSYSRPADNFDVLFQGHLSALRQMSKKFPNVFGIAQQPDDQTEKHEKR